MVSDSEFWNDQFPITKNFSNLTLTHFAARCGVRAKYKQPFVAQSEVTLAHPQLTSTLNPHKYYLNRRGSEVSGLYNATAKWQLRTQASNPCTHTHLQRQRKEIHPHEKIRLPSHLRILFAMVLISMSPYSESGMYTCTSQISLLYYPSSAYPNAGKSFTATHTVYTHTHIHIYTHTHTYTHARPPQRSHQDLEMSSKVSLANV